ncbi:flagella basal body P-ring formation protein FlgA [Nocardia sp. 2]|uniref:Flagella basal body P-ring formation protein FlgA n=1 Tax=Nocardia acididurans TaxID=2802282 RepID=A0ABS1M410_9NOCA|nr:SAF domain-containing protein [Nocardia acididurans]MBL1075408.1 flagella basal body P-ring formation protein FlgA [Nocardia acididurans]
MSRLEFITRLRPVWADSMVVRRVAAVGLCLLAAVVAMRGDPGDRRDTTLVATRDLPPGHVLRSGDLRVVERAADTLPAGVVREAERLIGGTLTGALGAGEVITELRVVGPRLAAVAGGSADARIVPVRLADNAVADILRSGDRVDVVAAAEDGAAGRPARLLATDAAVVLISAPKSERGQGERVVLVALDARRAAIVAAASLHTALTVVFH